MLIHVANIGNTEYSISLESNTIKQKMYFLSTKDRYLPIKHKMNIPVTSPSKSIKFDVLNC